MKKKGMIAAVAMIAAFIAVMPTAVTANAVSAAEIQEETEELRKDSADGVYNHLKYTINNNNTITITGMDNANDDTDVELVIPAEIDGRKVTGIGDNAFSECVNIKSIVLNAGLVEIYTVIETELGRTLSPIEYETISGWLSANIGEDLIKEALKEAVLNGVGNLKYIDKILYDWTKKGYKKASDVKRKKRSIDENVELFEYDWLDEND